MDAWHDDWPTRRLRPYAVRRAELDLWYVLRLVALWRRPYAPGWFAPRLTGRCVACGDVLPVMDVDDLRCRRCYWRAFYAARAGQAPAEEW